MGLYDDEIRKLQRTLADEQNELASRRAKLDADERDMETMKDEYRIGKLIIRASVGTVLALVLLIGGCAGLKPQYKLYQANVEKQAQIAESRAKAEAAKYEANAERTRAQGVADANKIVASSITDQYIRWLYVDQMDRLQGQVIYIPTEGGLPILEAGKRGTTTEG